MSALKDISFDLDDVTRTVESVSCKVGIYTSSYKSALKPMLSSPAPRRYSPPRNFFPQQNDFTPNHQQQMSPPKQVYYAEPIE
jgi:hypothetical protein